MDDADHMGGGKGMGWRSRRKLLSTQVYIYMIVQQ